jgi:hypothetical protein
LKTAALRGEKVNVAVQFAPAPIVGGQVEVAVNGDPAAGSIDTPLKVVGEGPLVIVTVWEAEVPTVMAANGARSGTLNENWGTRMLGENSEVPFGVTVLFAVADGLRTAPGSVTLKAAGGETTLTLPDPANLSPWSSPSKPELSKNSMPVVLFEKPCIEPLSEVAAPSGWYVTDPMTG